MLSAVMTAHAPPPARPGKSARTARSTRAALAASAAASGALSLAGAVATWAHRARDELSRLPVHAATARADQVTTDALAQTLIADLREAAGARHAMAFAASLSDLAHAVVAERTALANDGASFEVMRVIRGHTSGAVLQLRIALAAGRVEWTQELNPLLRRSLGCAASLPSLLADVRTFPGQPSAVLVLARERRLRPEVALERLEQQVFREQAKVVRALRQLVKRGALNLVQGQLLRAAIEHAVDAAGAGGSGGLGDG
jgi:hypothetical protein